MAEKLGQLYWEIAGENKKLLKSVKQSEKEVKGFGRTTTQTTKKSGAMFKKLGSAAKVAGIAIGAAVVAAGVKVVGLASDAEETQNKFDVTFSSIRDQADMTAESLAENYGLSRRASKALLSDTGDLLTGFGFAQESALDLSEQVNTLAVDLASFTNYSGGAEGASAALTKALLGERESIKSLGIAITEADINRLAEDKGITGNIDRQTKAMLTLELATSQSKNAIGDFARSQDSFANTSRVLSAKLEDLGVTIGSYLLPIVTDVVSSLSAAVTFVEDLFDPTSALDDITQQITQSTRDYTRAVTTLNEEAENLTRTEKEQLETRRDLAKINILKQINDLQDAYDKYQRTLGKTADKLQEAKNAQSLLRSIKKLDQDTTLDTITLTSDMGTELRRLKLALMWSARGADEFTEKYGLSKRVTQDLVYAVKDGVISFEKLNKLLRESSGRVLKLEGDQMELKTTYDALAVAIAGAYESGIIKADDLLALDEAIKQDVNEIIDAKRAQEEQEKENTKAEEENTEAVKENTEAVKENADAVDDAVTRAQEAADRRIESIEEVVAAQKEALEAKLEALEAEIEAHKEAADAEADAEEQTAAMVDATRTAYGQMQGIIDQFYTNRQAQIAKTLADDIAALRERGLSEEVFQKKKTKLEQEAAIKSAEVQREQAVFNKATKIADIVINTASAVVAVLDDLPFPADLIAAATISALGATQAGLVAAQPLPPIPSFESGGIVPGTEYKGDNVTVKANSGEMVLTGQQQQALFRLANEGPKAGGKTMTIILNIDGERIAHNTIDYVNNGSVRLEI